MNKIEKEVFMNLFNRGGYVLDFSTYKFDEFTRESVGIALCSKYGRSKGQSLNLFLKEAPIELSNKLLLDLLEYYELAYPNFEEEKSSLYANLYAKCKTIVDRYKTNLTDTNITLTSNASFSTEYINCQMKIMLDNQSVNPTESIGKAKELIESCCKTILVESKVEINNNWSLSNLVDETMNILEITPDHISNKSVEYKAIKAILGNLKGIASNMAKIRNTYGSGHGKVASYKGLQERHAKLAIGSSITLVNFLWDSFERKNLLQTNR